MFNAVYVAEITNVGAFELQFGVTVARTLHAFSVQAASSVARVFSHKNCASDTVRPAIFWLPAPGAMLKLRNNGVRTCVIPVAST